MCGRRKNTLYLFMHFCSVHSVSDRCSFCIYGVYAVLYILFCKCVMIVAVWVMLDVFCCAVCSLVYYVTLFFSLSPLM